MYNHPTSLGKRERQGDYLPPRQGRSPVTCPPDRVPPFPLISGGFALAQILPLQKSSFYDRLLLRWRRTRDELPFLWLSASSGSEGLSPLRNTCSRLFFRFGNSII